MFIYPIFANWVWGGGWLSQLGVLFGLGHGHVDQAGSSVVHMVGGSAALAGALALGPRLGKYSKNGRPLAMPGHNIAMAMIGTFILAFGWFGFNAGSTLSGVQFQDCGDCGQHHAFLWRGGLFGHAVHLGCVMESPTPACWLMACWQGWWQSRHPAPM